MKYQKGQSKMKLTTQEKQIARNVASFGNENPATFERSMLDANPDAEEDDGSNHQDEFQRAKNHMDAAGDAADEGGDTEHFARCQAARDCLNSYLAGRGREAKNASGIHTVVFNRGASR
jgi:hypothetical protein